MQDFIPRKKDINGEIEPITVKQYDNNSRFLHVKILDDDVDGKLFDLTDCTASLYIQPKDNTDPSEVAYIAGEASFDEENGGIATFLLPGSVTQNVGEYECEIHINEGDTENYPHISTKPFIMTVEKSIRNDEAIMASAQFSALDRWASDVQNIKSRMDAIEQMDEGGEASTAALTAAVANIRTGKGQTYDSPGDAVRASVQGISSYLSASELSQSPISKDFNNLPNNVIRACGFNNSEPDNISANIVKVANAPVNGQMTGLIITFGRKAERMAGDTQVYIPWHGGAVQYRQYNSVSVSASQTREWSAWVHGTEDVVQQLQSEIRDLPQYRVGINSAHADYNNLLSHYTDDGFFIANPGNWTDLPYNSDGFVIINTKYSNYILQTAVAVTSGLVYNRIVHSTNFTVFRDWEMPDGIDRRLKVLAVGDSICYGGRNNNKGFIGDLGLQDTNKSIVGIRLSERNSSATPSTRDVESGYFRPSIPRLFDFAVGAEPIPNASDYPNNMQFNANVITSLSVISLPANYQPDVIIVNGGTNDYIQSAILGDIPTIPVYDTLGAVALDRTTIMGGLQYLFYRMTVTYPAAEKFFLIQHKVYNNNTYWPLTANTAGYTQQELHDAIVACCRAYGIKVIDIFNDSPLNTIFPEYRSAESWSSNNALTNTEYVDSDGIHPMALGYKTFYVPLILAALKGNTSGAISRAYLSQNEITEVLTG